MITKTNAMRVLDQRKVPYTPYAYDDSIHSADGAAAALGVSPSHVFKTLVVLRDKGKPLLIVMPGNREVDLKLLAAGVGEKRVRMATRREAEELTGLLAGGISALTLLGKGFSVFLDTSALQWNEIYVSAGQRGVNLRLRVEDFVKVTGARVIAC